MLSFTFHTTDCTISSQISRPKVNIINNQFIEKVVEMLLNEIDRFEFCFNREKELVEHRILMFKCIEKIAFHIQDRSSSIFIKKDLHIYLINKTIQTVRNGEARNIELLKGYSNIYDGLDITSAIFSKNKELKKKIISSVELEPYLSNSQSQIKNLYENVFP